MFSIVIAIAPWETKKNILSCVSSIINVKEFITLNCELILVQDGPITQNLWYVKKKYDYNIRIMGTEYRNGPSSAWNLGLCCSSHNWILRQDIDDIFPKKRISELKKEIQLNPNIDIFFGGILEVWPSKKLVRKPFKIGEIRKEDLYSLKNRIFHVSTCFKKEKIIKIGGYSKVTNFIDWNLWLRANKSGLRFYGIDEIFSLVDCSNNLLDRRRGYKYAITEIRFWFINLTKGYLPIRVVAIGLLTRPIARFMPKNIIKIFMKR